MFYGIEKVAMNQAKLVEKLAKRENADIFLYNAPIFFSSVDRLRNELCSARTRRENAIVFLTTFGGEADSAYRLTASLRRKYRTVSAYVFGPCKSAGTLAVLGADALVFGDFGELGPLDVQMTKPDEIVSTGSGLDIFQALGVVTNSAFEAFEGYLLKIIEASEGHISAKTAAEIARELAVGLYAPVTAQIEPERLGEVQRAVHIANEYGKKLSRGNLRRGALEKLVQGYPSHGYVIDLEEARELFVRVRDADQLERQVAALLPVLRPSKEPIIADVVQHWNDKGAQNVSRAKDVGQKRSRRPSKPRRRSGRGNVAQFGPDTTGHASTANSNDNTTNGAARRPGKPAGRQSRGLSASA